MRDGPSSQALADPTLDPDIGAPSRGGTATPGSDSPFVYVDDLDAHLLHAEAAGATIVSPITEHGFRSYVAADGEGRNWVFAQAGTRIGREIGREPGR